MTYPSTYTEELAEKICQIIATHPHGLWKLHEMYKDFFPTPPAIHHWKNTKPKFLEMYLDAKKLQAEVEFEAMDDIVEEAEKYLYKDRGAIKMDSGVAALTKLKLDVKKFKIAKLLPRKYGDLASDEISTARTVIINRISSAEEKTE